MPNNDFYDNLDSYIEEASNNTDKKLALYLSSITTLRDEEILELFPNQDSMKNLAELIEIVSNSTNQNQQLTDFVNNAEKLGGTAIKLLSKLIL